MAVLTGDAVNRLIDKRRQKWNPTPVRLYHVPNWFLRAIREYFREVKHRPAFGGLTSELALPSMSSRLGDDGHWLDHWGSTVIDGREAFVSEPYAEFSQRKQRAVTRKWAEALRLKHEWRPQKESWWFPGSTYRVVFWRPTREHVSPRDLDAKTNKEAWIDRLIDLGMTVDAECWSSPGTMPGRRQMTLLSNNGLGNGSGWGHIPGGGGRGNGYGFTGYGYGHWVDCGRDGVGEGYGQHRVTRRGRYVAGCGKGSGYGDCHGGGRYPKLCYVEFC